MGAEREAGLSREGFEMETVKLNNGVEMPLVGLGTFRLQGYEAVHRALDAALGQGYRSVDTAAVYGNEADIGRALRDLLPRHGLARHDLFVTSKLGPRDMGQGAAEAGCLHSLEALGLDYLDLYLVHWPGKQGYRSEDARNPSWRRESWEALERMQEAGSFRAIGVSNYTVGHLREMLPACRVAPAVLQSEFHPRLVQRDLLDFCSDNSIHLQAYSSLGRGELVAEDKVLRVAASLGRTPAQVLLRWAVQQGVGVIPKSSDPLRIGQNRQLFGFCLGQDHMDLLSGMHSNTRYCWDSGTVV
ncbi:glyoxal reductase-like [Leucoraja erinacea]|uniref:glyoxal reductase-like n=1 Tax=Leucoraja erinaceus TaxID=7782 RepID=UPI0024543A66|nr:glyoxal reductase-like [Leucoraja erinacea]